jgi:thiol:disulfide interchange protein DsbA
MFTWRSKVQQNRLLIAALILVVGWCFVGTVSAADSQIFTQGASYVPVSPTQPTTVKTGQIEVIEFFWYGCPHCFALEPYLESWIKDKPANVVFKRIPVAMAWGEHMDVDGYAYYTAQALGLEPKIHTPLFNAIHQNRQLSLTNDKSALQVFFKGYGISKQDFDATWNSFSVQLEMNKAADTEKRYGLEGVPTIIVNGKWKTGAGYKTSNGNYMTPVQIMRCVNMLVQNEASGRAQ